MNKSTRQPKSASEYASGILQGDRMLLSQAITLAESTLPEHQRLAQDILERCLHHSSLIPHSSSLRITVTGSPGVGKSTFIEAFGSFLTERGHKVAVLTIDPSSQVSGGSILGDKTRMSRLAAHPNAFIRPSPAGDSLGGVAAHTREAMLLCEAAGFDTLIIETVGVGQSEVAVHDMVDFFLLLLLPGAGDELQGIKRGIVEMADLIAVNKADGERKEAAHAARREYAQALHLFPKKPSGWTPKVMTCSALTGEGLQEIGEIILDFQRKTIASGWFSENRKHQVKHWLRERIGEEVKRRFFENPRIQSQLKKLEEKVVEGQLSPEKAVEELMKMFEEK